MLSKRRSTIAATLRSRFVAATKLRVIFSIADLAIRLRRRLSDYCRNRHRAKSVSLTRLSPRLRLPDAIQPPGRVGKRGSENIGRKKLRERKDSPCSLSAWNSTQWPDKWSQAVI